jgi:ATP-dependent RNA helicase SUPV3L1/SUV3
LAALWRDPDIAARARGREAVERLWDVCRIPDFGKVMSDGHARLLGRIYRFLCGPDGHDGRLPTDWVARQVERVNRTEGDIDTLMQRIANIRTWTYIAYQGWLADSAHWQERTRAIEDNLSDVLHQRLIQRFVDRTTSVLVSRMRERRALTACVNGSDEVHVEGHYVGTMDGFRFVADNGVGASAGDAARVVTAAAVQALRAEMALRVKALEGEDDAAFTLAGDGSIRWRGGVVARLVAGAEALRPRIEPQAMDLVEAALRERVARRLGAWLDGHLRQKLKPLFPLPEPLASPAARGLLFQLAEKLGCLPRAAAAAQLSALGERDHVVLRSIGLTLGRESIFFRVLLKPGPAALRALLWAIHNGVAPPRSQNFARASLPPDPDVAEGCYAAAGFIRRGPRVVRADILERLAANARQLTRNGPAPLPAQLQTLLGCDAGELVGVLRALGFRVEDAADGPLISRGKRPRPPRVRQQAKTPRPSERSSPFAVLRQHVSQRP